jgi:hypothetical protein
MMTLYDHIQELRSELSASSDAHERRQIEAELQAAFDQQATLDAAFEARLADMV